VTMGGPAVRQLAGRRRVAGLAAGPSAAAEPEDGFATGLRLDPEGARVAAALELRAKPERAATLGSAMRCGMR
jgi:hypothetical protein